MNSEADILIVDDDSKCRKTLFDILKTKGYTPIMTRGAEEALDRVEEGGIHIALIDLRLEGMSGLDLMKEVKKRSLYTECILLTGYASQASAIKAMNLGAYGYVQKPYDVDQLLVTIQRAVEKRNAEEALRESEERFRQMAENIKEVFWMTDPKSARIIYISPAYEDIWQRPIEALYEDPGKWIECVHEDDIEMVKENWKKHVQAHSTFDEFRILLPDGSIRWIANRSYPIKDDKGNIYRVTGIAEDITDNKKAIEERVELEAMLRQSQKMEAIGTLAGGIAHDFNNILSAVIGYTELSLMKVPEDCGVLAYLNEVYKAGNRAKELVAQILAFSRQTEQELKPVMVKPVVKEALKLLRASLPTTIEIHKDIQSESMTLGDPTQIHQVLMNLCANASHAMEEKGGVLRLELVDVEIDSEFTKTHPEMYPGPYIKLTVSDTGRGMSPHVLDRIFDPFFTTKEKGTGTGMGLSVVHGIVKSYGGSIYASSKLGKGSTFEVFFPTIEEKPETNTEVEKPIPGGTQRILFVDDEPPLADMGKQLLESLGYKVTIKTSSFDSLELFRKQPDKFDLVITDMTMPNMTGDELAKEIMSVRSDVPVILCTGFSSRITEDEAKRIGVRAFVSKPVLKREIGETIHRVLDGN